MSSLFARRSEFDARSLADQLLTTPLALLATTLYRTFVWLRPLSRSPTSPIRVVCISDTHTQKKPIPHGDLLIHAGDLANIGSVREIQDQVDWLNSLEHKHKVVIAGNHDTFLDPRSRKTLQPEEREGDIDWGALHYLQHSSVTLDFPECSRRHLKIYGAPQIPLCGGSNFAFQYVRQQDAWSNTIPNVDVLVTHTPPFGHLDLQTGLGCKWLLREIWRVRPRLHVFAHVHAGHGMERVFWDGGQAAYESLRTRSKGSWVACLNPFNWLDIGLMMAYGLSGVLWSRLWGGRAPFTTMVNAALMSGATGNIDRDAQIVVI